MSTAEGYPVLRSLPTTDGVTELVRRHYGLDVVGCELVRSFVNDVYRVRTAQRSYVLKLYRHGGLSVEEIAWESELIGHLVDHQIPVAEVVPLAVGDQVGVVRAPEGDRAFMLSEYVSGAKPQQPYDDALYHEYGGLVARLHEATRTFRPTHHRRQFELSAALDEPMTRIGRAGLEPETLALVEKVGSAARRELSDLGPQGPDWGARHGDVTLDNVHRTEAGLVIHDFDRAEIGWRVADLGGCLSTPFAKAFRAGYTEIRAIGAVDEAALPWLSVVESIANLDFHLSRKPAWRGTESLSEGWVDGCLDHLRQAAVRLL